jgi:CRISPR/Cas system-associated protein Cas10 (large subunit of type III CRISPR-Cas system)
MEESTASSDKIRAIALAGLLHDIGKLVSRSYYHRKRYEPREWFAVEKWPHAGVGAYFLKENLQHLRGLDEQVLQLVRNHHNPSSLDDRILQLADWLASGERKKDEDLESRKASESRMISVFSRLFNQQEYCYYHATPLQLGDQFFPCCAPETEPDEYKELMSALEGDLSALTGNHLEQRLLALLEKYLWAVPAQTPTRV